MKNSLKSFIFLPLILVVAIVIVVSSVKSNQPVIHQNVGFPITMVKVITAEKIPFRARSMAFGNVEPSVVLNTKSEVSGKISYKHVELQKGASIAKGTVVLRIEPTIFKILLTESLAVLANSQSALLQLEVEEKSTIEALTIVQKNLAVERKELERNKALLEKHIISYSDLDKAKQKVLSLQQQSQNIEGKLGAFVARRASINAQIKQSKSQVDKNRDTLSRTEIRLPFDARIGEVAVEKYEFVQAGSILFEALGVRAVEIIAQLPVRQFRPLVTGLHLPDNKPINLQNLGSIPSALSSLKLEARVRLVGNESDSAFWQGRLINLSASVDPIRDTLSLVVLVDQPYDNGTSDKRPPLLKGMFTSVEFLAAAKPALVLPRKAVHQGRVYIATEENKLTIRTVDILFTQGDLVVISDAEHAGVKPGESVIISDVIPVMEGLPLKVVLATEYEEKLKQMAMGVPVRGGSMQANIDASNRL